MKNENIIECDFCGWNGNKKELLKNNHCPKCQSPSTKKNIMKTIITILIISLFVSCQKSRPENYLKGSKFIGDYEITKIEGCEYIVISYKRSRSITHKGNCKNHK